MTKYEYKIIEGDSFDEKDLNKMGLKGWELVTTVINKQSIWNNEFIFKRKLGV